SISLATVTPSLVRVGLPYRLSMTTFRPFGPSVTLTACDRTLTPRMSAARASSLNRSWFVMDQLLPWVREWWWAVGARVQERTWGRSWSARSFGVGAWAIGRAGARLGTGRSFVVVA